MIVYCRVQVLVQRSLARMVPRAQINPTVCTRVHVPLDLLEKTAKKVQTDLCCDVSQYLLVNEILFLLRDEL